MVRWPPTRARHSTDDVSEGTWIVAGSGEHVKALVRSHASGDDDAFLSIALQVPLRPRVRVTTIWQPI
jgi:hypothetical protein